MADLAPILKKKFPQGSTQGDGECITFLHKIFDFPPMGDSIAQKIAFVKAQGECSLAVNIAETFKGFRIGDFVVTAEGCTKNWLGQWRGNGHGAVITGFDKDCLVLAESNYALNGKVTYGRRLQMNSPLIIGIGRFPFLIDLGLSPIPFSYDVFINNQTPWNLGVIQDAQNLILVYSNGNLKPTLFPLQTSFKNWHYEDFSFNGTVYKVIAKDYLMENLLPASFTNHNAPANAVAFIVRPDEWQGTVYGKQTLQEIAWANVDIKIIQGACAEKDLSPWYPNMPLIQHILIHEIAHYLCYVGGSKDTTDIVDNQNRKLSTVFNDLDWNRIALNL